MANIIQLKRGTGSSEPSSLAVGELAINIDSGKLFYGSGSSVLSDFRFDKITAETYVISSSVTHMTTSYSSGSTEFGDSAGDTHTFTGPITASGNISSSANVYAADYFNDGANISTIYQAALTFGIADTNVLRANANVADNDFLRVDGTSIEGRSAAQVRTDIGAASTDALIGQDEPTDGAFVIADDGRSMVDSVLSQAGSVVSSTGHISSSTNIYAADYFDNLVNINTIYSPIAGHGNIVTVGTITTGTWNAGIIAEGKLQNQSGTNTGDEVAASLTTAGVVELATSAETNTGTDADRAVTPDGLEDWEGSANVTTLGTIATGTWNAGIIAEGKLQNQSGTNTGDEDLASINALDITELGTISSGVWEGTVIASAKLDTDTAHLTTDQTFTGIKQVNLRKFPISSGTDGNAIGDVVYFGGTTSMTVGTIYHYKSDGTWEVANANAVATSDGLLGVALGAASDTNGMLLRGMVTLDHDPGAVGDVLYLSNTNGDASATAPSDSDDVVRVIGYCLHASAGNIWFNPDSTYVEIA